MALQRDHMTAFFQIIMQCIRNLISKIDHGFVTAFSPDLNAVIFKINIINI